MQLNCPEKIEIAKQPYYDKQFFTLLLFSATKQRTTLKPISGKNDGKNL